MESTIFNGGVPLGPDVNRLVEHFVNLRHEQIIAHRDLAAVLGLSYPGDHRYRAVIGAWRKVLRDDQGFELQSLRGVGYRVMTDPERVDAHIAKTVCGIKTIGRAGRNLALVPRDTLPEPARARADNAQAVIAKMTAQLNYLRPKLLNPPQAADTMPRSNISVIGPRVEHQADATSVA